VTVRVLGVDDVVGRGMLQYSKFLAWDENFLAHPFQSMGTANAHVGHPLLVGQVNEAMVEHMIFCWNEEDNWSRKEFRVPPSRVNDIHHALAVHQGKLFALQEKTTRVWQIDSGELLTTTRASFLHCKRRQPEFGKLTLASFFQLQPSPTPCRPFSPIPTHYATPTQVVSC